MPQVRFDSSAASNMGVIGTLVERALHGGCWGPGGELEPWLCVQCMCVHNSGHWGQCGPSCLCCRYAAGERNGSCLACVAAAQSLPIVSTIASFCCFAGETAVRALSVRWSWLPTTVVELVGDFLPKTSLAGTVLVTTEIHPWRLFPLRSATDLPGA